MGRGVSAGQKALETPQPAACAEEAGVVDAGGQGITIIFEVTARSSTAGHR
ncbi:MAG: hypothetical protein ACLRNA_11610 [Gemmiger formicilis]